MSTKAFSIQKHLKVNIPSLFKEIVEYNKSTALFRHPLMITKGILGQVAERAIELEDPKLIALVMRLSLLSVSDPKSPDFDQAFVSKYIEENL